MALIAGVIAVMDKRSFKLDITIAEPSFWINYFVVLVVQIVIFPIGFLLLALCSLAIQLLFGPIKADLATYLTWLALNAVIALGMTANATLVVDATKLTP